MSSFSMIRRMGTKLRRGSLDRNLRRREGEGKVSRRIGAVIGPRGQRGLESSFLMTSPPFMTKATCSMTRMSRRGSPVTAMKSAYLPGSIVPMSEERPRISAGGAGY